MIKLIKFGASYCAPCRAMMPILEELKNKIEIEDIDVDEVDPIVLTNYKIRNIPVLVLVSGFIRVKFLDWQVNPVPENQLWQTA